MHIRALIVRALAIALLVGACGGEDLGGAKLPQEPESLQQAAAAAMGEVTSVQFTLERTGSAVYIDAAESMSLDALDGRFTSPSSADAIVDITVNDSLRTKIGAVAIAEEIWMSNPVTGDFETLPPGFDIDPSSFFDPKGGWQPLLENLTDVSFVGEEQRDGTRYHLTGTAPAAEMQTITAGLVRGQDVKIDFWLHPVTARVTAVEFETFFNGETSMWVLELTNYGDEFEITDPTT